jgi:hypothetical protein
LASQIWSQKREAVLPLKLPTRSRKGEIWEYDYKPQGQALTLINKGRPGEVPGLGGHLTHWTAARKLCQILPKNQHSLGGWSDTCECKSSLHLC